MIDSVCECDLIEIDNTPFYECYFCGLIYSKQVIDQQKKRIEEQLVEAQEEEELKKEKNENNKRTNTKKPR